MDSKNWICSICLEDHSNNLISIENCGHTYHLECIYNSMKLSGKTCPYCRQPIDYLYNEINDKFDDNFLKNNYFYEKYKCDIINNITHKKCSNYAEIINYLIKNNFYFWYEKIIEFFISQVKNRNDLSEKDRNLILNKIDIARNMVKNNLN